jgi:saccharopine dehydrogenase-like NADP-dependent oxidoreductase
LLLACGLEPGLSEILARGALTSLPSASHLEIRCGGIPAAPVPPLGHVGLFGERLSLADRKTYAIRDGRLCAVPRFSGVELIDVGDVGRLEAFHDGMLPWLVEDPLIGTVPIVTQKTLRWPGFASRIRLLHDLGLLSQTPTRVRGVAVCPRDLLDALFEPVTAAWTGGDVTVLQVEVHPADPDLDGVSLRLIDRGDAATGLTSMARTTGFTLAACAALLTGGAIRGAGWLRPERVIAGRALRLLLADLARFGVVVGTTVERHTPPPVALGAAGSV